MASVIKAQKANAEKAIAKADKGKKRERVEDEEGDLEMNEVEVPKRKRNKQRVLMLSSRGVTHRMRHLMKDLETLLPHVKKGEKRSLAINALLLICTPRFEAGREIPTSITA